MPLKFIDGQRYDSVTGTVRFAALDPNGKRVVCAVSQEGLADLTRAKIMDEEMQAAYLDNIDLIHRIIEEKFDRKRIRADGVVIVTAGDLAPYG
jgi:hypothetical protein